MALRGTLTHRKVRRLGKLLGIPACYALGVAEALWHVAAEQAPDGAVGRMSNADLAEEMFFDGDRAAADELVRVMVLVGLLDEHPVHRLIVHDWHLHSDDTTNSRLARATQHYANGEMPRLTKLGKDERERVQERFARQAAEVMAAAIPGVGVGVQATRDQSIDSGGAGLEIPAQSASNGADIPQTGQAAHGGAGRRTAAHNGALPEPEPEPEPDAKARTPQPPLPGGRVSGSPAGAPSGQPEKRVVARSAPLPRSTRPARAAPELSAELEAEARRVMVETGVSDPNLLAVIARALEQRYERELRCDGEQSLSHFTDVAIKNRREYVSLGELLKRTVGARRFFSDGLCWDWRLWPLDQGELHRRKMAAVGRWDG